MYTIESYGMSHVGRVRQNNEDVFSAVLENNFFILADGMGGHNAGEVAAAEAVKTLCEHIRSAPPFASAEDLSQFLREAVSQANEKVWKMSLNNASCFGMGTTLSCFLIYEDNLIYAHIGDSRIYRYREHLEQLTSDHSLASVLLSQGESQREAKAFKNVITKALGTTFHVIADIGILSVLANDMYLVCSDGLTDLVSDEAIEATLRDASNLKEAAKILVDTALRNGGNDNITVLLVKVQKTSCVT